MKNKLKSFILTTDADFKKHGVNRDMRMTSGVATGSKKKSLKLHKEKGDKRLIEGFFSTTQKDRVSDVITVKALKEAKGDLLKEGANTVFMNHDTNIPIGRVLSTKVAKKDGKVGLFGKILISKAKDVNNIWIKIKENILNAFSIRLAIKKMEILKDETTGKIEEFRILSMELFEVSVVGLPCNAGCSITSSSGKSFGNIVDTIKQQKMIKRRKSVKKKSKGNAKTQASFVKELVTEANSGLIEQIKSIVANGGKSEDEIAIEAAQALLKSKGLLADSEETVLTEDQKEIAKLKKQLADSKKSNDEEELTEEQKEIKALKKQLAESKGRKGGDEEEADDEEDDSVAKKCLKSADDQDTISYVCHIMDEKSTVEYEALTVAEKEKDKSLYMELQFAQAVEA